MSRSWIISVLVTLTVGGIVLASESSRQSRMGEVIVTLDLPDEKSQFAVWVTDSSGEYRADLYVTGKTGQKGLGNRRGDLDDKIGGARLSALPVWAWMRGVLDESGNPYPTKKNGLPDAVSGATPRNELFTCSTTLPEDPALTHCIVWVEVNASFDNNEYHDYSWYRGQPSLIYRGTLDLTDPAGDEVELELMGHGTVDGGDGSIDPDLSTITTALELVHSAKAVYLP